MRALPAPHQPPAGFGGVKVGDTVSLEMNDGSRAQFVLARIEEDQLVSPKGERYRRTDIVALKRRAFSPIKTGILAAVAATIVLFIALGAAYGGALDGL